MAASLRRSGALSRRRCSSCLVAATAPGAAARRARSASATAAPSAPSATTVFTRPAACAWAALQRAPLSRHCRATASPSRCQTKGAICAGGRPSVTSGVANTERSVAITTSAQHTRPKPPPMAGPSTAITSHCGSSVSACSTSPKPRFMAISGSSSPGCRGWPMALAKPPRLPPALKAPPAPVSTMPRKDVSCLARRQASNRASTRVSERALRVPGSLSVQRSVSPCRTTRKLLISTFRV